MENDETDVYTVCDTIIQAFLEQLSEEQGLQEIAVRLEKVILKQKPTEKLIRSAFLNEQAS